MIKKWVFVFMMSVMVAMLVGAGSGFAFTRTWTGSTNTLWSVATNWNEGSAPVAGDDIVFDTLAVANNTNTNDIDLTGVAGITITVNNPSANVVVTLAQPIKLKAVGTQVTVGTTDALSLLGNTITLGGVTTFSVGAGQTLTITSVIAGAPAIDKTGTGTLKLNGNDSYAGTTSVTNGTLLINGTPTGGGAITVFTGATLGGSGNTPSAITINSNGTFNPGDVGGAVGTFTTQGVFTFSAGSFYIYDISGAAFDQLVVNGGGTYVAGGTLQLGTVASLSQLYTVVSAPAVAVFTTNNTGWSYSNTATQIRLQGVAGVTTPTLTEWGVILFAIFIAMFAIWSIRRKNYTVA